MSNPHRHHFEMVKVTDNTPYRAYLRASCSTPRSHKKAHEAEFVACFDEDDGNMFVQNTAKREVRHRRGVRIELNTDAILDGVGYKRNQMRRDADPAMIQVSVRTVGIFDE